GYVLARLDLRLGDGEGLQDVAVDQEADERGERGGAVGLLGEADRDTDAEQHRQVVEDRATGGGEDGGDLVPAEAVRAEDVRLAEPEQDARRRKDGDRELKAAAHLLQALEQA